MHSAVSSSLLAYYDLVIQIGIQSNYRVYDPNCQGNHESTCTGVSATAWFKQRTKSNAFVPVTNRKRIKRQQQQREPKKAKKAASTTEDRLKKIDESISQVLTQLTQSNTYETVSDEDGDERGARC